MKVKVKLSSVIFTIVSVCILILTPVITSHADLYESWMRTGENEVYTQSNPSAGTPPENTEEQDSLIKHVTKFMWYAGEDFSSKYYKNDYFAFSLDGVVNGRLSGYDISIGKFELYENNPYGIIGAYGYIVLRNLVYGLMFLYFLILLIRYMATSGSTQRN